MTATTDPIRVLFLCTHNSARSQIAEGLLRALGDNVFASFSAGTEVTRVHPLAIEAMHEIGVDITGQRSKLLTEYLNEPFDAVVTVCDHANERCPIFPGAMRRLHWSLPDPSAATGTDEERLVAFRAVRDTLAHTLLPPFIAAMRQARTEAGVMA